MTLPARLPNRRPMSFGDSYAAPQPANRRLARAEAAIASDLHLHDLDVRRRLLKAEKEVAAAARLIDLVTRTELSLYRRQLASVGQSLVAQELLADRLNLLVALNSETVERFRR